MGQLDRSRALAGEGLEGLIPRGSQLLQLGGSFFLAFVPFIIGIILLTGSLYVVRVPLAPPTRPAPRGPLPAPCGASQWWP